MRWSDQEVRGDGVGAAAALPGLRGLLRSVRTPEFAGTVFHEVEARSALNRVPGSSPVPFRWTVNPYRGCSHACVYCLAGDTRVLMADGGSRPISALRVGDAVIGTELVGGTRRYVPTTVSAHWSTVRPAVRVRLAGGTEIVASGEHRFLTDRGWRHVTGGWCRSGRRPRLRPGTALLGPGPFDPGPDHGATHGGPGRGDGEVRGSREPTAGYRLGYLCGLVRGDGDGDHAGGPDGDGGGAAVQDRVFPSAHLELEALGRAHHYLAVERDRRPAPVLTAVGGVVDGRIAPPSPVDPADRAAPADETTRWPERPGLDWCTGFLAGVLDARGDTAHGELRLRHTDEQVVGRIAGAVHRLGFRFAMEPAAGPAARPERVVRLLGGAGEFTRFLRLTDPAVARGRDLAGAPVEAAESMRVVSVERTGRDEPMYDITTGTGDFVAEGVVSHNCFARGTHTYLDLDPGDDFDRQIVVKVNVARVLQRELRAPRWAREPVAMGTNTDPYQRAEGRYALMPGIVDALARSGTPFSLLTKGTVLTRDLPRIASAAADVPVGIGVSIALLDRPLQARLEPGTPSPEARLDLVRRIADAGLACGVMVAPVLPLLTDSAEALDALFERIRAAGATSASVLALHLRPGTRDWFLGWLGREHPRLVAPYERLYRRGSSVDRDYRRTLDERVAPLLCRHGLDGAAPGFGAAAGVRRAAWGRDTPRAADLAHAAVHAPHPGGEQLSLL